MAQIQLERGPCSPETDRQTNVPHCGTSRIIHSGATSSKFTVSTLLVRNMGSTWTHLAPTWRCRVEHGTTWLQAGPVWEQLRPKLSHVRSARGTLPQDDEPRFHWYSPRFLASTHRRKLSSAMFPVVISTLGPNLVRSCHQTAPSCGMCSGSMRAQLQPNLTHGSDGGFMPFSTLGWSCPC